MAVNDVKIRKWGNGAVEQWQVQDRTSSGASATIKAGEPVKMAADGSPYVILLASGDPEVGTDIFVGIAMGESTETATADGVVEVFMPGSTSELACAATTSTNFDAQSEIDALVGDCVAFDLTTGTFTVDENEGNDDNVHGLRIVGGDPDKAEVWFRVKSGVTSAGSITGQTMD